MHAEAAQLRLSSTFMSLRTTNRASGVSAPMASCHQVRVCLQRQRAAGVSLVQTRSTVCLLVSNVLLLRVGTTEPQIGPTLGCQGHCFFGVHPGSDRDFGANLLRPLFEFSKITVSGRRVLWPTAPSNWGPSSCANTSGKGRPGTYSNYCQAARPASALNIPVQSALPQASQLCCCSHPRVRPFRNRRRVTNCPYPVTYFQFRMYEV